MVDREEVIETFYDEELNEGRAVVSTCDIRNGSVTVTVERRISAATMQCSGSGRKGAHTLVTGS